MTVPSTPRLLLLSVVAVFAVGCSSRGTPSGSASPGAGSGAPSAAPTELTPSTAPSVAAATLVLKVTSEGGFINPVASLNALPLVEVWSDGRILTAAPVDAIYPGPLVNPVAVRDVGAAGAAQIVAAIRAAGLDRPSTAGPGIPGDAGSDTFVVTLDGQTTTTRLSGNGPGGGRPGFPGGGSGGSGPSGGTDSGGGTGAGAGSGAPDAGSGAPDAGGASLVPAAGGSADPGSAAFALLGRLTDPSETWGSAAVQPSIYQPLGYRIFAAPGAPTGDATTAQSPVAWPLSTPLDAFGTPAVPDRGVAGLRQGAVVGADAATVGPVFAKATQSTPFTSAGKPWTLYVRELLPDELGG